MSTSNRYGRGDHGTARKPGDMTAGWRRAALTLGLAVATVFGERCALANFPMALTPVSSQPTLLTAAWPRVFFTASDDEHGRELWVTDGTVDGTHLVTDLLPGPQGSLPRQLRSQGDRSWFIAVNTTATTQEFEVFVSDASAAGTYSVRTAPSDAPIGFSRPQILASSATGSFWSTSEGLWHSDGTKSGTVMLASFSKITSMAQRNGTLYLAGNDDGADRNEIWQSDGTVNGTALLSPIGPLAGYVDSLTFSGSDLFFSFEPQGLWVLDVSGEPAPIEILSPSPQKRDLGVRHLTAFGELLVFSYDDAVHGRELWRSDGTPGGTGILADVADGPANSDPEFLTVAGSTLFFAARESSTGAELWKTDGTRGGTVRITDLRPGEGGSFPTFLAPAPFNDGVLFAGTTPDRGSELWWSSSLPDSAKPLAEIIIGPIGANPRELIVVGLRVFFVAKDADGASRLWVLDIASPRHFRWLPDCLGGPDSAATGECSSSFGADRDDEVDLSDIAVFLNRVSAN
jgi:ELWxxDGT repeat protein